MNGTSPSSGSAPRATANAPQLRGQLDVLARRGERLRWRSELGRAIAVAGAWWPLAIVAGPLSLVVLQAGRLVAGDSSLEPHWPAVAGIVAAGPLLWIAIAVIRAGLRHRPDRAAALAWFEPREHPIDRLRCADGFLRSPRFGGNDLEAGLMRAAVAQQAAAIDAAGRRPDPALPRASRPVPRQAWWGLPVTVGLLVLSFFLPLRPASRDLPAAADRVALAAGPSASRPAVAEAASPRREPARPAEADPLAATQTPRRSAAAEESKQPDQPWSEQAAGSGAQASASVAAAAAASKATPQRAAKPSPEDEAPRSQPDLAAAEPPRAKPKPRATETAELAAQADSGHGRSPSSSSNPPSPFDQAEAPDKAGALADRDVEEEGQEDEDEQQKAEQSSQPTRSQQVADVNRNLSPFTPPPGQEDLLPPNGRGGPGDVKKSRGVPSMILGIPVPDRVPGTPGPGRTKVTQEFAEPTPESHPRLVAQSQGERNGLVGPVQQPELVAWRRQVLERYFRHPRQSAPAGPAEEISN